MTSNSSGVERARLEQDAVGDADLADVVHRAGVAKELCVTGLPSDGQGETLAEDADSPDVLARVLVSRFRGRRQTCDELEIAVVQLHCERSLFDAGCDVVSADRSDRPERPGDKRIAHDEDGSRVERDLCDQRVRSGERSARDRRGEKPQSERGEGCRDDRPGEAPAPPATLDLAAADCRGGRSRLRSPGSLARTSAGRTVVVGVG